MELQKSSTPSHLPTETQNHTSLYCFHQKRRSQQADYPRANHTVAKPSKRNHKNQLLAKETLDQQAKTPKRLDRTQTDTNLPKSPTNPQAPTFEPFWSENKGGGSEANSNGWIHYNEQTQREEAENRQGGGSPTPGKKGI